jgi:hypothetical protein
MQRKPWIGTTLQISSVRVVIFRSASLADVFYLCLYYGSFGSGLGVARYRWTAPHRALSSDSVFFSPEIERTPFAISRLTSFSSSRDAMQKNGWLQADLAALVVPGNEIFDAMAYSSFNPSDFRRSSGRRGSQFDDQV